MIGQFVLLFSIVVAAWLGGVSVDGPLLLLARALGAAIVLAGLLIALLGIRELRRSLSVLPRPVADGSSSTVASTAAFATRSTAA